MIPARACARIGLRLVPHQDPHEIGVLIKTELERRAPRALRLRVGLSGGSPPLVIDQRSRAARAAGHAYACGFGVPPLTLRSGGTIPIAAALASATGAPVVLMGFALPDDSQHGANERFHLPTFARAIATCIAFLDELGRGRARRRPVARSGREAARW